MAVAVGALLILLLWKLTAPPGDKKTSAAGVTDASVEPTAPTYNHKYKGKVVKGPRQKHDGGIAIEAPATLDPKGEAFNRRIDVGIAIR